MFAERDWTLELVDRARDMARIVRASRHGLARRQILEAMSITPGQYYPTMRCALSQGWISFVGRGRGLRLVVPQEADLS